MAGMIRGGKNETRGGTDVIERSKAATKRPSFYVVVLHNDDVTPRHFVVHLLRHLFSKSETEATRIMMLAHNFGVGVVASYPYEIAEAKADRAIRYARENGYPLQFSTQRED